MRVFHVLDDSKIDDPNFGEENVRLVDDLVAGLGPNFLGWVVCGDKSGKLLRIIVRIGSGANAAV